MKKSQVLAALALAFALGVVAPVASVLNSADTYAAVTMSDCDLKNAIAQINAYGPYQNFKALFEVQERWNKSDLSTTPAYDESDIFGNTGPLVKAIRNFGGTWSGFTFPANTTITQAIATAESVETSAKYNEWNQLYTAMTAEGTNDKALRNAVAKVLVEVMKIETYDDIEQYESFTSIKTFVTGSWTKSTDYANYVKLIEAVNDATEYKSIKDAFVTALDNVQDWSKIAGKEDAVKDAADRENSNATVTALNNLASNTDIAGYNEYYTLYTSMKNAKVEEGNTYKNDTTYNDLEDDLKAATLAAGGRALGYKNIPAFNGTCGVASGNDGTGEGSNKPGDNNDDNKAPNTGILSDAEGSASTTVAMVAGIATALTAAGAGVVAYRNARRSTRK